MTEELIDEFGEELDTITLVKGEGGRFVVTVNGEMVFSKKEVGRHAEPGEIVDLIMKQKAGNTFAESPNTQIQA